MGVGLQESILRAVLTHGEVEQGLGADREAEGWEDLPQQGAERLEEGFSWFP